MGVKKFLKDWLVEITPHAKWDLTRWLLVFALAGVTALGVWVTAMLSPLLNNLTVQQRVIVLLVTLGLCTISFVSLLWALFVRPSLSGLYQGVASVMVGLRQLNENRAALDTVSAVSIPPPPTPPSFVPRAVPVKEIDLRVEVLDIIYKEHPSGPYGGLLSGAQDGWFILMRLRVTNHGTSDATVTRWKCEFEIGSKSSEASVVEIPASWFIDRPHIPFAAKAERVEIGRPTLDHVCEREPLRRGIPQTGWVLFDQPLPDSYFGPHNAGYRLELHDSLGGVHLHSEPARWSQKTGEIKHGEIARPGEDLAAVLRGKAPGPQQPPSAG